jgi:hypothetical protein
MIRSFFLCERHAGHGVIEDYVIRVSAGQQSYYRPATAFTDTERDER